MDAAVLNTVFVGLVRRPFILAFHRHTYAGPETYEVLKYDSYRLLVVDLLTRLGASDPRFMARVSNLDDDQFMQSKHKTRRYVAESRELLYIATPSLGEQSAQVLGYWVAMNIGRSEVDRIVSFACKAAGLERKSIYSLKISE